MGHTRSRIFIGNNGVIILIIIIVIRHTVVHMVT